jgi:hypothetical protein
MRSIHRGVALVLAATLVAASCGDDDTEASDPTTTTTTTTEATDGSPTSTEVTTTSEPIVLTDSFRGVTADTILVGYPTIDFDRLNNDFGLDLTFASFAPAMERMVEDLNDRGGIHGREVEMLVRPFLPVGPVQAEQICVELTEDREVFAVLGGFAGPGAADVNECFTDLHDTILVGGNPTPEQLERASAPWITNSMRQVRRAAGLVDLLEANDRLDEVGTLGIIASTPSEEPIVDAARTAFVDAGNEVAFHAIITTTGDEFLTRGDVDTMVERGRREGVDSFLFIGDDAYANEQLVLSGDDFNLIWLNSDQVTGWRTDPPPGLDETKLLLASGSGRSSRDDPEWADCVRLTDEAYGVEIKPVSELELGEINHWSAMVNACLTLRLFEEVATAAGPDLTNESFAAAVESFGSYTMPGSPFASLGPGKYDGQDTLRLTTWNHDEAAWEAISEAFDNSP